MDRERYSDRGVSDRFVERGDRSADPRMMERGHSSHRGYSSSARDYNRHYDDEYFVQDAERDRDRDWIERERYQPLAPHQSTSSPHRSGGNNRRVLNAM